VVEHNAEPDQQHMAEAKQADACDKHKLQSLTRMTRHARGVVLKLQRFDRRIKSKTLTKNTRMGLQDRKSHPQTKGISGMAEISKRKETCSLLQCCG